MGFVRPLVALTAFAFARAHRALYPGARPERFFQLALMLPAPTVALRAGDKLSRTLLVTAHPIAAALALLDDSERTRVVHAVLRDLRTPRVPVCTERAAAIERAHRTSVGRCAEAAARAAGVDVEAAFAAPSKPRYASTYCPRCHTAYRDAGVCADCGLQRVAFP